MVQEAKDLRLADLLPYGWKALQDTSSDAKAGSAVGYRTDGFDLEGWWLTKGCDEPAGGGMLPRWIVSAELRHRDTGDLWTAVSCHAPPPRYSELQPGFNANVAKVCRNHPAPVVGTDANMDLARFADALGPGFTGYGEGGIGLVSERTLEAVMVDYTGEEGGATDHPSVSADV
jgi:hypothetical protein